MKEAKEGKKKEKKNKCFKESWKKGKRKIMRKGSLETNTSK